MVCARKSSRRRSSRGPSRRRYGGRPRVVCADFKAVVSGSPRGRRPRRRRLSGVQVQVQFSRCAVQSTLAAPRSLDGSR